ATDRGGRLWLAGRPLSMLAFGPRLRRLAALTGVCQPALVATIDSTASLVPAFGPPPFMRGFSPPLTGANAPERTRRGLAIQHGDIRVARRAQDFQRVAIEAAARQAGDCFVG
ncbi:MAG TPA: hypothetical protein VND19_09095, partial [Acetobacteraceae bacterium]|nr:hypothetical protein [Acetobacteraceae bacterium]